MCISFKSNGVLAMFHDVFGQGKNHLELLVREGIEQQMDTLSASCVLDKTLEAFRPRVTDVIFPEAREGLQEVLTLGS